MSFIKKIVWAVDAFPEGDDLPQDKLAIPLGRLLSKGPVAVDAVHVLTPNGARVHPKELTAKADEWRKKAEASVGGLLNALPPTVSPKRAIALVETSNSTRATVKALLDFARGEKASLIAVMTHGRSGIDRFFLGSFAETLLLLTDIPLLVVNPETDLSKPFDHVLFPTDYSQEAKPVFKRVVELTAGLGARLTLFSGIDGSLGVFSAPALLAYQEIELEIEYRRRLSEEWRDYARERGVPNDPLFETSSLGIPRSILRAVDRTGASLIAMEARGGGAFAAGSTPRQIVRHARVPVLLIPRNG